jgi:fatty acid desaturase
MHESFKERISELRKDRRNVAIKWLFFIYGCLLVLFIVAYYASAIHWVWLVPVMGFVQYYIVISGHEAVHETLCYPKKVNEFFGVFGQALVGVNFTAYRQQHIDHHTCKSHETDPDGHIYYAVISSPKGLRRFLMLTVGTFVEIIIKIRQKGTGGYGTERKKKRKTEQNMIRDTVLVILAQLSLMILCTFVVGGFPYKWANSYLSVIGGWQLSMDLIWSYAVLWTGPLFVVTVFLNRCRIVIEHGLALQIARKTEDFGGPRIPTVDIVPNWLERRLFAPFLFNYHCSHHLYMSVPHYNLPRLYALLKENEHKGHHCVENGYIFALRRTMSN